jgi:hypothetical protein
MDRFTRICLLLIVLLLAVVALRPVLTPQLVHASKIHPDRPAEMYTEYDVYVIDQSKVDSLSKTLTNATADGWEVVSVTSMPSFNNGENALMVLIAK